MLAEKDLTRGYMAYAHRSPLIIGCRSELLRRAPSLEEAAHSVLRLGQVSLHESRHALLAGLGGEKWRYLIHVSEDKLWGDAPGNRITYHGSPEDMGIEACRKAVNAVLIHYVHPISGERISLKPIIEGLESCERSIMLVVDISLAAGIVEPQIPSENYAFFYRLDKWLMGPPLILVHSDRILPSMSGWDAWCAASSIRGVVENILGGSGRERLLRVVDEISWEADRLGLRVPTPPERERRAAMLTIHAGGEALSIARLLASRGVIVDAEPPYIRISPHADVDKGSLEALLQGLAEARSIIR